MKLTLSDILVIKAEAAKRYAEIPAEAKFADMDRPFSEDERKVIAYLDACTMILNKHGTLKTLPEIPMEYEDSDPIDRIG